MNYFLIIILAVIIGNYLLELAVEILNVRHLSTELPGEFDGYYDQGRDRKATKYLVPKRIFLSKALNQIDRQEGLAEVKGLLRDAMTGRTMIARFLSLGPLNSLFTILGLQCTDSWYVAHSEDLLYRPGYKVFTQTGPDIDFLRVLHSAEIATSRKECLPMSQMFPVRQEKTRSIRL